MLVAIALGFVLKATTLYITDSQNNPLLDCYRLAVTLVGGLVEYDFPPVVE